MYGARPCFARTSTADLVLEGCKGQGQAEAMAEAGDRSRARPTVNTIRELWWFIHRESESAEQMARDGLKLRRDEMDQLRAIRDEELNLPERWFTGKEWADGTAERVIAQDYRAALIEADYEQDPGV